MPRKTKEQNELENEKANKTTVVKKNEKSSATKKAPTKSTTKKASTSSKSATKSTVDEISIKKSVAKSATKSVSKKTSSSATKDTTSKKADTKKTVTKKASKVTASTKPKKSTKAPTKKSKKTDTKLEEKKVEIVEYYDLPYRYNQTVVKVLAQTPNNLFIYWDISDEDREHYKMKYGENFFEVSKPVLIVHNDTLGYSFEVEINDFANSWYLHVNDSKCDYRIELGRRPWVRNEKIYTDYVYVSTSNEIESPNDHILLSPSQKMVYYRNVKTNKTIEKPITQVLSFLRNMGKFYDIYDIYKEIYKEENIEEIFHGSNPSSGNPSSGSFSSQFK